MAAADASLSFLNRSSSAADTSLSFFICGCRQWLSRCRECQKKGGNAARIASGMGDVGDGEWGMLESSRVRADDVVVCGVY
jgi:hypothetical protein